MTASLPVLLWWCLGWGIAGLLAWSMVSTQRVLYPERRRLLPPQPLPPYTTHTLTAVDGAPFDLWRLSSPAPRGRILLCHGYYANRLQVLGLAGGLHERGYEAILIEWRGHGSRPGPFTFGLKETADAECALQWAARQGPALPLGVLGLSMGGAIAIQIAGRTPQVRAVVVDSTYAQFFPLLADTIRQRYHLPAVPFAWLTWWALQGVLGARLSTLDPMRLAPRRPMPLLAIQGTKDAFMAAMLPALYDRWAGPKEQWLIPGVRHVGGYAHAPAVYIERVAAFFDRALTEGRK